MNIVVSKLQTVSYNSYFQRLLCDIINFLGLWLLENLDVEIHRTTST